MTDITALGEILIDLTQTGVNEAGVPVFAANPGGAPANLAVAAAKLGASAAFIGKAGNDAFGNYLKATLERNGVDVSAMVMDSEHPTTMAVVSVDDSGERDFSFYRDRTADVMLTGDDIPVQVLQNSAVFHFGSVSLTTEPARSATMLAAKAAKANGAVITYDPNYRPALWADAAEAVERMKEPLPLADILKVSDEELPLLSGTTDCEAGTAILAKEGISLILVTLGPDGVFYRFGEQTGHIPGIKIKVGDTNGAGDTFFGAALSKLSKLKLADLTVSELEDILRFANKAAAITTSRRGAIPAMPTLEEVAAMA